MFFPQELLEGGGGSDSGPPHPILLLGCQNAFGDFRTWGSLLAAMGARMGVLVPLPVLGYGAKPHPDPTAPQSGSFILPAPPINKGLGSPVAVPGMWGCCGGALPAPPPNQAQRGSSQSIYWCWPRSELLRLPLALAQTSLCGVHGWGEGVPL